MFKECAGERSCKASCITSCKTITGLAPHAFLAYDSAPSQRTSRSAREKSGGPGLVKLFSVRDRREKEVS